jgi:hypothetical protein
MKDSFCWTAVSNSFANRLNRQIGHIGNAAQVVADTPKMSITLHASAFAEPAQQQ